MYVNENEFFSRSENGMNWFRKLCFRIKSFEVFHMSLRHFLLNQLVEIWWLRIWKPKKNYVNSGSKPVFQQNYVNSLLKWHNQCHFKDWFSFEQPMLFQNPYNIFLWTIRMKFVIIFNSSSSSKMCSYQLVLRTSFQMVEFSSFH